MPARRTIVDTSVGLGAKRGDLAYMLDCPKCGVMNRTPDAGTSGHITKDNKAWYYFNCACGCRYKAEEVPLTIPSKSFTELIRDLASP